MPMHNTNSLLKYVIPVVAVLILVTCLLSCGQSNTPKVPAKRHENAPITNSASNDSAAESLDTLTADLQSTKVQVAKITKDDEALKQQNKELLNKLQGTKDATTASLAVQLEELKKSINTPHASSDYAINTATSSQTITTVTDLTQPALPSKNAAPFNWLNSNNTASTSVGVNNNNQKSKPIPYYTIPANATAVHDRLMTALVGRIPVKGVVTDPYPFKIVFSDDTLAANGLRVPHLRQMIVSGYTEGDLNLVSVRGWVTSLTFVFDDGTISTTTSNNNDIGHFTKENALGYLSDAHGNPFIRGKLITNAPAYLSGNILLGAAQGAASAYAQEQTTSQTTIFDSSTSTVTGSPGKYVLGQAGVNAASQAQQWWHDREEQSFDAVYVPTVDDSNNPIEISVNFSKEIQIDYNPAGRKIAYANHNSTHVNNSLD